MMTDSDQVEKLNRRTYPVFEQSIDSFSKLLNQVAKSCQSQGTINLTKILLLSSIVAILLILAMPGTQSLWIDEAQTYHFVKQPNFASWRAELLADRDSEAMMPLGMLAPWLAAKVLGTTEWSMRAINILWAILALIPFILMGKKFALPWLPLLFAVQPFLYFYANEARPYTLQIAEGAWLLFALIQCIDEDRPRTRWAWCFAITGLLLCATSLLGVVPFFAALTVLLAVGRKSNNRPLRNAWIPIAAVLPVLLLLGGYYLWVLHKGAESSKVWAVSPGNVAFSMYELLGFTGLGPGRSQLRQEATGQTAGLVSYMLPYLPALVALFGVYCIVGFGYYRALRSGKLRTPAIVMSAVILLSILGLGVLAAAAHFPFWGRHLAPIFPAVVILLGISLNSLKFRPVVRAVVTALLCVLLFVSSWQLGHSSRHSKDDYRVASNRAAVALSAGKRVWWFADVRAARYYGLDVTVIQPFASRIAIRPGTSLGPYKNLPLPDLIILSKPDIYDPVARLRTFIRNAGYHQTDHLQAFQFFTR